MWSNVISVEKSPPSRSKHDCVLIRLENDYVLYMYGGRSGTFPLKDFWKLELKSGKWTEINIQNQPSFLQEHSIVHHNNNIYIFGGEISINNLYTPLWIFNIKLQTWRRWNDDSKKLQLKTPVGRRGHTANVWNDYMIVYGGYQDLKGSLGDLWAFHFETESWHMYSSVEPRSRTLFSYFSPPPNNPPPRHSHVSVLNGHFMYCHGGMNDLLELSDLWRYDLLVRRWTCYRVKPNPGPIHGHVGISSMNSLLIMTGERDGKSIDGECWRFDYHLENWEKILFNTCRPCPRINSWAGVIQPQQFTIQEDIKKPNVFKQFINNDYQALNDVTHHFIVKKSNSVKFAEDNINKIYKSTSDYSSMDNFNSFDNPNYDNFEMGPLEENGVNNSYMFLIGGNESHLSQVVKKPLSIWRLRLTNEMFGLKNNCNNILTQTTGF